MLAAELLGDVCDRFFDAHWRNAVFFIVRKLHCAAAVGLAYRLF